MNDIRLSPHFKLGEFLNLNKYPQNVPTMQHVVNMAYGCLMLLEPAYWSAPLSSTLVIVMKR